MKLGASLCAVVWASAAFAGDGVFDAQVLLNHDGRRGMTEIQRVFTVCFDPKGKDRKFEVGVKVVAGDLRPDPDTITVTSEGKVESRMKMTYDSVPLGPNNDEKRDACYRISHKLTIPMGGLKSGTVVSLTVSIPKLKKKKGGGTHQAELVARARMP